MTDKQLYKWCERIDDAWQKRDHKREKRLSDTLVKILTKEKIASDIKKEKTDRFVGIASLVIIALIALVFHQFILMAIIAVPFIAQALKDGANMN